MGGVDNFISDLLFTYDVNAEYTCRKDTAASLDDSFSKQDAVQEKPIVLYRSLPVAIADGPPETL